MICCLNPHCHNPPCADGTNFCIKCGIPLAVLRHYRPIRRLGGGGFGTTYLAEDVEKFNELCVIKQFAPQVQGSAALLKAKELFEQEARRLQHLGDHPQIPALFAYFKQDNRLYLVQQYIEGQNLFDELEQQGTFSDRKIRELLRDLLEILKVVHQQQVIHRDIKPENIIRRSPPAPLRSQAPAWEREGGELVLIDFGASKQATATAMVKPGTVIGSFGYVPIEQMQGGEAYPSSDLYSLGATCFHLLTGIHPWEVWKKQAYSWVQNWRQHLQQPVSQELGDILDKLLQENHLQRYQSAEEVLQDLNRQQPPPNISRTYEKLALANTLTGHTASVASVAISPDGETLVSGSIDKTIKIWNLKTHQLRNTLTGHTDRVYSVAISPDGNTLVSGGKDKTIKMWNLLSGELTNTLTGHKDDINFLTISPDGQILVSGSKDNTIKIWNLKTGELKNTLTRHTGYVNSVTISKDGQTLVSGSSDKTIKIWNLLSGELRNTLTGHTSYVNSVALSLDGQTLVSGSWDNTIKIWNLKTSELKNTLTGHTNYVISIAINPDKETLMSGSYDNTIKIWNLKTSLYTLTGHTNRVYSIAISKDGQTLVSGSSDKTIKIWRVTK